MFLTIQKLGGSLVPPLIRNKNQSSGLAMSIGLILTSALWSDQEGHVGPVTDIAVGGERVFSVSQGGLYEGTGSDLKRLFSPPFRLTSVAIYDNQLILVGGEPGVSGMVGLYDPSGGKFHSTQVADDLVYDVAVHPDDHVAALACADNRAITIALPDLTTESIQERYRHTAAVRTIAFSKNGDYLASGGLDALVMLLPLHRDSEPIGLQDHSAKIDCLVFSPDSTLLASGARDGKVRIHNLDGRLVRTYTGITKERDEIVWNSNATILSLAWGGPQETLFAGAAKGSVYQLSTTDNRWTKLVDPKNQPIYSLAFNSTGVLILGAHDLSKHHQELSVNQKKTVENQK